MTPCFAEEALVFACEGEHLVGLLNRATVPAATAVLIVVGGPQYRAGSHRQFVHLARTLADCGYPVLRFDVRGMGDSTGSPRNFESIHQDIAAAADCLLTRLPDVRKLVLVGLCDGASAALLYLQARPDARVAGLCVFNPWVRSDASLAITHVRHYYGRRLLQPSFWRKLLGGGIKMRAMSDMTRAVGTALGKGADRSAPDDSASFQRRMAAGWSGFAGPVLLVTSGRDFTAKEFLDLVERDDAWRAALQRCPPDRHELTDADHTFSDASSRAAVERLVVDWLQTLAASDAPSGERQPAGALI